MAKLTVKLHGEEISQIELESGTEYIAGRAPEAQIRLDNQRGISRQHLKFYERDGLWVCESLSKFVHIQRGSESMGVVELNDACVFMVSPFEFVFEPSPTAQEEAAADSQKPLENLPAFYQPRPGALAAAGGGGGSEHTSPRANNDATVAGGANLVPYFRISFPNTADDEVLKLEGHLWVAGRDPDCEITIDSPHVSRKHFELARTNSGYFITDLGSSNGTKVNGLKIPPHEPTQLTSGDDIRVMSIEMTFEIRDTQFANRVDRLPVPAFDPMPWAGGGFSQPMVNDPTQYRAKSDDESAESDLKGWRRLPKKLVWGKNKLRSALMIAAPLLLVIALIPGKKATDADGAGKGRDPTGGNSATYETLNKEQKLVVKDSFNLATTLYTQGKYALCLTELAKLHEIIPLYNNSKELQSFCEQGLILKRKEEDAIRQARERNEIEAKVQGVVAGCKESLGPQATEAETSNCLGPALDLAPQHPAVLELIHTAHFHEEERQQMEHFKEAEGARAARGQARFKKAMATYKEGNLSQSIAEFEKFLNEKYPHLNDLKDQAKRQIASIKKERQVKVESLLEQCKGLGGKSQFRDAYKACDLAVKEDPDNSEAKTVRGKMLSELHREMKSIYEDSVLEESMGNVDTAKEKWKKIMQEDLEGDDYSNKAKGKLQKYGIGG
jgi:pSer/pThr/pTyr-binding forkhead associated (FHA) protein/tetratricopeptide (TPR) repeat protein